VIHVTDPFPKGNMHTSADNESMKQVLKEYGLHYSAPRATILQFFLEAPKHVSAEDLHLMLKDRGSDLSLSSVYLNLNVFSEARLIRTFQGLAGETIYCSQTRPHDHLICRETGEVLDIPEIEVDGVRLGLYLKAKIEEITGWQVDEPQLKIRGVSPKAKAKE
jgi:Fe2+ or Zn2+ uptake regulation protein